MSDETFSIQKYIGVTPQQFANLQAVLIQEPIRKAGQVGDGWGPNYFVLAETKSVAWDREHGTLTVEVAVYDYSRRYLKKNDAWTHSVYHRYSTSRDIVDKILNALERFSKDDD